MSGLYEAAKAHVVATDAMFTKAFADGFGHRQSCDCEYCELVNLNQGAANDARAALSAQRAEWKKRRGRMCVTYPFYWQHDSENAGEFSRVYYKNGQIICDACPTFHDERPEIREDESGKVICAALNLYFGFSADGSVDYLKEGM